MELPTSKGIQHLKQLVMDFYLIFLGIENIWLKRIIHLDFIYIFR
jgi:hypothetical protein